MSAHAGTCEGGSAAARQRVREAVNNLLLATFAPAAMVVSGDLRVWEICGDLEPHGIPAVNAAAPNGVFAAVLRRLIDAPAGREESYGVARLQALPLEIAGFPERLFCIVIRSGEEVRGRERQLETELRAAREYLETTIDEYETATEELHAAFEELRVANEELRSLNGELASANRKLAEAHVEHDAQVRELDKAAGEITALLRSIGIPMLIVDSNLRLRRWTPQAARAFNLKPADAGRRVGELRTAIVGPSIEEVCAETLNALAPQTRRASDTQGRSLSFIARPYWTRDNQLDGVLLMLLDSPSTYSV